jgi:hypothetical protein
MSAADLRVLIRFNAGIYETIDLSQWIAANPNDVPAIRSAGGRARKISGS